MNGFRFYADLPGTLVQPEPHDKRFADPAWVYPKRITVRQLKDATAQGKHCNVIALLLGREHRCADYSQECLSATFGHADSDTSFGSVGREYLQTCRRIPESLARQLHPRLFARLDQEDC